MIMSANAQWNIIHYDTTCYLYGLYFTDSLTGYAVGSQSDSTGTKSLIRKTTDGGTTWTTSLLPACASHVLWDVKFTDYYHGIAVGGNGLVLLTNDGGSNWTCQNSNTNNALVSVCFPTSNIGYAVGLNKRIIKTFDGGITWNVINEDTSSNLLIKDVFFINADTGFYVCGSVFRTTDGGLTWTYFDSKVYDAYGVYFINKDTGYVCGNFYAEISKTVDGGLTWNLCYDESYQYSDTGFTSIFFIDDSIGFAIGGSAGGPLYPTGPKLCKTFDGGNTWLFDTTIYNVLVSLNFQGIPLTSLFFINQNVGFITSGYKGIILKTTTGGGLTNNPIKEKYEKVIAYPNPSKGTLRVSLNKNNTVHDCIIQISDTYGKHILKMPFIDNENIDISFMNNGIYILQIISKEEIIYTSKFIIMK